MNEFRNALFGFGVTMFAVGVPLVVITQQLGKKAAKKEKSSK